MRVQSSCFANLNQLPSCCCCCRRETYGWKSTKKIYSHKGKLNGKKFMQLKSSPPPPPYCTNGGSLSNRRLGWGKV